MAARFERAASYWEVITLFSATCDTVKAVLERLVRSHVCNRVVAVYRY